MGAPRLAIGQTVGDKYQVERFLGEGGMGEVYAARHIHLQELVALKCVRPEVAARPNVGMRFQREAIAAARIKNEHVARVHDFGKLDDGRPFIVMELLEGQDLSDWIERAAPLAPGLAVQFALEAAEGLIEAHRLGIVHRDLKPSNLFCVRQSNGKYSIKIVDFGIAKFVEAENLSLTTTGSMLGSPLYSSPEQLRCSNRVDHRTDIWSLGVVLYEMLTGEVPFPGTTLSELSIIVATEPPKPLHQHRPDIPAELEAIVLKALAKSVDDRYATMAEFAHALAGCEGVDRQSSSIPEVMLHGPALPAEQAPLDDARRGGGTDLSSSRRAPSENWVRTAQRTRPFQLRVALASMGVTSLLLAAGTMVFLGRDGRSSRGQSVDSSSLARTRETPPSASTAHESPAASPPNSSISAPSAPSALPSAADVASTTAPTTRPPSSAVPAAGPSTPPAPHLSRPPHHLPALSPEERKKKAYDERE